MRHSILAALLCVSALGIAHPASAQDMRQKISEEIRLNHERAHELQAIGQGDEQMAQNLNNQAAALDDHANRLDQRSREMHVMANAQMFNPGARDSLNKFADELDGYARNDRANVAFRRRVANDMANSAHGAYDAARQHEDHANRMQQFLNQMGGQQPQQQQAPMQQTNPWQ